MILDQTAGHGKYVCRIRRPDRPDFGPPKIEVFAEFITARPIAARHQHDVGGSPDLGLHGTSAGGKSTLLA